MPATPALPAQAVPKSVATGLVLATLGAIAFSGKAIIVKLAYRHGVDAVTLIMLRMLFALPLFAVMAWWAGRGKPKLTLRDWLGVFLDAGVLTGAALLVLTFVSALWFVRHSPMR